MTNGLDLREMENGHMEDSSQTLCRIDSQMALMRVAEKAAQAWYGEQHTKRITQGYECADD